MALYDEKKEEYKRLVHKKFILYTQIKIIRNVQCICMILGIFLY